MAEIVNLASFIGSSGQELSAADAGWTLAYQSGSAVGSISDSARVLQINSSEAVYTRSETPGSENQTVSATIRQLSAYSSNNHVGIVARKQSGVNTYIVAQLRSETGGRQVRAYKLVGNTPTQIGSSIAVTTVSGNDYGLQLEVTGQSPNISVVVKLDGATLISQTINDTNLDAAGSVGLRFGFGTQGSTNTTGLHVATFSASDDTGGSDTALAGVAPAAATATAGLTTEIPLAGSAVAAATASGSLPASGTITITEPLKNNTGTLWASESGVRVAVLQASDLVSVHEQTGLTTDAAGLLAAISDGALVPAASYHVVIKLADGSVGITGAITAS